MPLILDVYLEMEGIAEDVPREFIVGFMAAILVSFALLAWFTIMAWRGRNWARIVHLVWFLVGMLGAALATLAMPDEPSDYGLADLLAALLNVAGLVLLFTPSANAWYRAMRERRRAR